MRVVKNKVAPPFKDAEFDIMYGEGISTTGDLLDMAVQREVIEKSGAWYSFDRERIGQGRENAKDFLKEHPDVSAPASWKIFEIHLGWRRKRPRGPRLHRFIEKKAVKIEGCRSPGAGYIGPGVIVCCSWK